MTTRPEQSSPGNPPYKVPNPPDSVRADIELIRKAKRDGTTDSQEAQAAILRFRAYQQFIREDKARYEAAQRDRVASSSGAAPSGTSSTAEREPASITADKALLDRHQQDNTLNSNDPEQRAASERVLAYEAQQRAAARAEADAQAAARAGAPPTASGGTAGTGAVASTPNPTAEAAEESNGGQGLSSNEQTTRIASNVDTTAGRGTPGTPSSEARVQDARDTIKRYENGGPVTNEQLEDARRTVAEKERYDQALRDEAEAAKLGNAVATSVTGTALSSTGEAGRASKPDAAAQAELAKQERVQERRDREERQAAEAPSTAVASTGGTAGAGAVASTPNTEYGILTPEQERQREREAANPPGSTVAATGGKTTGTTATQGTVAASTAAPYKVGSQEWLVDNAFVEEYRRTGRGSPAQKAAYDAAVDRMEAARLAKLGADTEAAAQPRTAVGTPAGEGAVSSTAASGEFELTPIGPLGESPKDFGRLETSSGDLRGLDGLPSPSSLAATLTSQESKEKEQAEAQARRTNMYGMEGVDTMVAAARQKERDDLALKAAQAEEDAKRKAAADRNRANWFEANRRINSTGFSGCDINALVRVPRRGKDGFDDDVVFNIGTLQTISISTYNSKTPVRALGFKNPVAIARGGRTIAGTMIFNQLHTHVLDESAYGSLTSVLDKNGLLSYSSGRDVTIYQTDKAVKSGILGAETKKNRKKVWDFSWDTTMNKGRYQKPSDIIPFDIVIWMINESGAMGKIILYDIDIIHDSTTLSVEDIYTEVQYQYMARDIEYFEAYDINQAYEWQGVTLPKIITNKEIVTDFYDPTGVTYEGG